MSQSPPARAARVFVFSFAVVAEAFALAKWAGWDTRPWDVVLSAAAVTAVLIAIGNLVANSLRATSR